MSIPMVMAKYRRENTFGTDSCNLIMPFEFKAKRHRVRSIQNPYVSDPAVIRRESLDNLEEGWLGTERRKGVTDLKVVVYQRDEGICGVCGNFVHWEEAHLDHKIPRRQFRPPENGDAMENLWILHRTPCHQTKTKRDLQRGGRVR